MKLQELSSNKNNIDDIFIHSIYANIWKNYFSKIWDIARDNGYLKLDENTVLLLILHNIRIIKQKL